MKRVKLVVAYDGTNYCGWQQQPNGICIEEVLNRELSRLLGEPIQVIGASRTDSGVHARGNVAVFDTNARMPADKICIALNQRLPKDIVIQDSCEVEADYHPRKRNTRKTYEYRILNRRVPLPDLRFQSYFYYYALDVSKMQEAAQYLVGEHDFKSFCSIRTQVEDTVRRIYEISVTKAEDLITIRISGNGFLYNMVRIIAGSLIKVGCGFWEPYQMKEVLEARDRSKAGPKAPPEGLTLMAIEEVPVEALIEEVNPHWSYRLNQREINAYGAAYLRIRRCDEADFHRLLVRLVKTASRNGAKQIHVCDETGHLALHYQADYFRFESSYAQWKLEKQLGDAKMQECAWKSEESLADLETDFEVKPLLPEQGNDTAFQEYCELENCCFSTVPGGAKRSRADLEADMKEGERCYRVLQGDRQIALFSVNHLKEQETEILEIESLGVDASFRGKGIGRRCLAYIEKLAAEEHCSSCRLICADSNPAMGLYQRFGYQKLEAASVWYTTCDEKRNEITVGTEETV